MLVNEAKKHLSILLESESVPAVMLWSPPGIGKSSIVSQIASEKNWAVKDIRLLLVNPVDLRGVPVPDREKGRARWLSAGFLPHEDEDGTQGILFLDEITAAPPSVQAAAYQLVLDRRIGEYRLPQGWRVVCAGNRITDRGVAYVMPSPLANRMIHIEITCSLEDWKTWAWANNVHPTVIAFLNFRPDLLYKFPQTAQEFRGFPTPRSWEFVSKILKMYQSIDDAREVIGGAVGEGPAVEFCAFARVAESLPDIEDILEKGETPVVGSAPDVLYALSAALVRKITEKPNQKRAQNFLKFIETLPVEFQALSVKDAMKSPKCIGVFSRLPAYSEWADKNKDIII